MDSGTKISDQMYLIGSSKYLYHGLNFATTLAVGNSLSIGTATIEAASGANTFFVAGSYGLMVSGSGASAVYTSVTGFDDVTADNPNSNTDSELLSAYSYTLTFDGNWTKLAGSI